ncbi:MAG: multicopper oxidase domain-containing protein, partial [Silvibacterium sp.]|nr:multicopper oxidase domain-containing protein [Silvibacterium sp.]
MGKATRRDFVRMAAPAAGAALLARSWKNGWAMEAHSAAADQPADYTLTIAVKPIEVAPDRIISTTTYNGQFPGPLLRFKEGQRVTVEVHNETDTPE